MASGKDGGESLNLPVIQRPRRKTWFLDEDLVRISHISRAQGIASLWNCTKAVPMTINLIEFKRKRKRAFTVSETALLLNYHKKSIPRLVKNGFLPPPIGELPNGERAFHYLSYYSEDHIWEARNLMAQTHMGRSRKDGLVTNNKTPTEQELRYAMGDGMIYYVKGDDGKFIPVFSETL
ncbi:MAG: hypothetical protein WAO31_04840 [Rhodoluna sp.]|jgi:hypothetical protein